MAKKAIENKLRQAVPVMYLVPPLAEPQFYLLLSRQRIVMDERGVGQDISDKEAAGHITVDTTTDALTTWLDNWAP